jgi:L-tryptophan--pyruvate aminotransferase
MSYQFDTKEHLKNLIKELHKKYNNIDIDNKYLVIGNGATQILKGLFKILGPIHAKAPYFCRFPILCDLTNTYFISNPLSIQYKTEIITIPNNPDGKVLNCISNPDAIYDFSYNWPSYSDKIFSYDVDIGVFSLSKATGHASTRIGWVFVRDFILKLQLEQFIEYDTSGVSIDAQNRAIEILNHVVHHQKDDIFKFGNEILKKRWKIIENTKFPFEIINNNGMFLLAKGEIPKNIHVLLGSDMGLSDDYFRINVGCSNEIFNEFINMI